MIQKGNVFRSSLLVPKSKAGDTRTRKLVAVVWYQKLAHVSVNLVVPPVFSGTSFRYGIEHSSIPSQKLCGTWHEQCNVIGRRVVLVQESAWWTCVKFFVQVSGISFWCVCRRRPA